MASIFTGTATVPNPQGPKKPLSTEQRAARQRAEMKKAAKKRTGSGVKGIGETAEGLFDEKVSAIGRAAKARSAARMRGAEKGLAADVGRSARMARGGGRGSMLADVGKGLELEAKADAISAEERAIDTKLEKQQFMADKFVSKADARENVESFIESNKDQYMAAFGDDEIGMAKALEDYANRKDISDNEREYALAQAESFRLYESTTFGTKGRGL